jgi:hypothetical protein
MLNPNRSPIPPKSGAFERHAWKIFVGLSIIIGSFGIGDIRIGASELQTDEAVLMQSITRMSWNELQAANPKVANLIDLKWRWGGADFAFIAILSIIICLNGFRRGERWAWYAMWMWPLWLAADVVLGLNVDKDSSYGTPVPVISGSVLLVVSVLTLALSYRRFFLKPPQMVSTLIGD